MKKSNFIYCIEKNLELFKQVKCSECLDNNKKQSR